MDVFYADVKAKPAAAWSAVLSMALCVAMLIASEFMPVSLLTPMADGLHATEGQTGQAISISGFFAVRCQPSHYNGGRQAEPQAGSGRNARFDAAVAHAGRDRDEFCDADGSAAPCLASALAASGRWPLR